MEADRQRMVLDTFVDLADTLASDYDVTDLLHFLVERCARLLEADTAGVLLESSEGPVRLAAAVSDEMRRIENLEVEMDEGPCSEAYRSGEAVIVEDLEECRERWPKITPALMEMGMRSAHAFPLRLRGDRIGALNLYRRTTGRLNAEEVRLAQAFADSAAIGILQQRRTVAAEQRAAQLRHALDSRIPIEQAKGVLAERRGIGVGEAFELIRAYARSNRRRLREVCEEIVAGSDPIADAEHADDDA